MPCGSWTKAHAGSSASLLFRFRSIITVVLGDLHFNFYHRWFDVIFLISALSSIGFLYLAHKQHAQEEKNIV